MSGLERLKVIKGHLTDGRIGDSKVQGSSNKRYRFTRDDTILTVEQRDFYEENGFILIRKLVSEDKLDQYAQRFRDICDGKIPKGGMTLMKDVSLLSKGATGERLYNKIQDFIWDDVFFSYCTLPEILQYVKGITGPDITAVHTMLINKPPDSGSETSRHPLHQDLHYFPFRPADSIVCSWTAMEPVTRENGCLVVLPGTHKGTLLQHDYPKWENGVNAFYHGIIGYDHQPVTHLEMDEGDTVFFHPILIHGSGANRTKGFRKAISCHYASSNCHYIDVHGTTQENIARELEELVRKRGVEADLIGIMQTRARLVSGEHGTLTLPIN